MTVETAMGIEPKEESKMAPQISDLAQMLKPKTDDAPSDDA